MEAKLNVSLVIFWRSPANIRKKSHFTGRLSYDLLSKKKSFKKKMYGLKIYTLKLENRWDEFI